MTRKLLGLISFIVTGMGLIVSTIIKDISLVNIAFLIIVVCFFTVSLLEHFNELKN